MGPTEWFSTFCSSIQTANSEPISRRYRAIAAQLNLDFWGSEPDGMHGFSVGSFGRETAVYGLSDLDVAFELPGNLFGQYDQIAGNGQLALLKALQASIEKTYTSTWLRPDGHVVVVPFGDGVNINVAPVFETDSGAFVCPETTDDGSWVTTSPWLEIEAIHERDKECNGNLLALCRMMRAWKDEWRVPMNGQLIDTFAYEFLEGWEFKHESFGSYDILCRDFFAWVARRNKGQERWEVPGSRQPVSPEGAFQHKASQCYHFAQEAIANQSATPKREWTAKLRWKDIFGKRFTT